MQSSHNRRPSFGAFERPSHLRFPYEESGLGAIRSCSYGATAVQPIPDACITLGPLALQGRSECEVFVPSLCFLWSCRRQLCSLRKSVDPACRDEVNVEIQRQRSLNQSQRRPSIANDMAKISRIYEEQRSIAKSAPRSRLGEHARSVPSLRGRPGVGPSGRPARPRSARACSP